MKWVEWPITSEIILEICGKVKNKKKNSETSQRVYVTLYRGPSSPKWKIWNIRLCFHFYPFID